MRYKNIILLIALLCALPTYANHAQSINDAPVALQFKEIGILSFAEATYRTMLGRDYVIASDVIGLDKKITIAVSKIERNRLPDFLEGVLKSVGLRTREHQGIIYIEKIDGLSLLVAEQNITEAKSFIEPKHLIVPEIISQNLSDDLNNKKEAEALEDQEPDNIEIYRPKYRTVEYLSSILSVIGIRKIKNNLAANSSNTKEDILLLAGDDQKIARAKKLLEQIDIRPYSVHVRAALIEYSDSSDNGFSIGALFNLLAGKLSIAYSPGASLTNFVRFKNTTVDAVVSAIAGDTRFRFISEPTIRIADGERGSLVVGAEVPIRGALTLTKEGHPLQSIEYRTSGVVLNVEPKIFEQRIAAKIRQTVSNFSQTKTSNIDSPTLLKRELETVVDIEEGELLILAGLDEDKRTYTDSGLAFLPNFMRSRTENNARTQLLVVMEMRRQ